MLMACISSAPSDVPVVLVMLSEARHGLLPSLGQPEPQALPLGYTGLSSPASSLRGAVQPCSMAMRGCQALAP